MLIECLIRRPGGTVLSTPAGNEYHFAPNESGAHVADVAEEDVERFIPHACSYRAWYPGVKNPWRAGEGYDDGTPKKKAPKAIVAVPRNLDEMTHDQLIVYAVSLGMRRPHSAISLGKLRMNVARFLDERSDALVPEDDPDEDDEPVQESDE